MLMPSCSAMLIVMCVKHYSTVNAVCHFFYVMKA